MASWLLETGLYLLGVAVIPGVGVLLVCFGLWGDRSKGRPRCPKCWYDMRGTVLSLECPECGHDAGSERRLYRTQRRWRPIAVGIVLVLGRIGVRAHLVISGASLDTAGAAHHPTATGFVTRERHHAAAALVRVVPNDPPPPVPPRQHLAQRPIALYSQRPSHPRSPRPDTPHRNHY